MDILNLTLIAGAAIIFIVIFFTIFKKPIKWALKLLLNAICGFIILFLVNFLGSYVGISVSVGWISAIIAGCLGIPGVILLILIENLFL